ANAVGSLSNRNDGDDFHRFGIDGCYGPYSAVGNVDSAAIGVECDPSGRSAKRLLSGQVQRRHRHASRHLEIGNRIDIDRVRGSAIDPERLAVGSYFDPMAGIAGKPGGLVGKHDASDLLAFGNIDYDETVESAQLQEQSPVGTIFDCQRAHSIFELQLTG